MAISQLTNVVDQLDRSELPEAWQVFFDASPFATLMLTPDLRLIGCNIEHVRNSGVTSDAMRGRFMFDVWPKNPEETGPDTESMIRKSIARAIETRQADEMPIQKHDLSRDDGSFEPRYWRIIHSPIVVNDKVVAIRQDSWDVTAAVLEAERQERLQQVAGAVAGIAFWELDVAADRIVHSPEFDQLFGFPLDEGLSRDRPFSTYAERFHHDDREMIETAISELLSEGVGAARQFEYRIVQPDGEIRHALVRGEAAAGEDGNTLLTGVTFDISDIYAKEMQLAELVRQKEALLDEVNHRVKNSLQLVSSILAIEARKASGEEGLRLKAAVTRIQSVAAVHASLYQGGDVKTVEMQSHLRQFCDHLYDSLGASERGISLIVEMDRTMIPADKAIPLSLIVNEVVTNALKYAFSENNLPSPSVIVSLKRDIDGSLLLSVSDNGNSQGTETTSDRLESLKEGPYSIK